MGLEIDTGSSVMERIRETFAKLEALAAWNDGTPPLPEQIYTPRNHGRVLDLDRTLVVGNRGVGKTFWSSALVDASARAVAAAAYPRVGINTIEKAVFGFRGGIADELTPDKDVLRQAVRGGIRPERLWVAVALRAFGGATMSNLPARLVELAKYVENEVEDAQLRLRSAAQSVAGRGKRLLLVFDALDRLGDTWAEIRPLTEGLFRFAISVRGLNGLALKIFVRTDQVADPALQQFPDASKLIAERVDLRWHRHELYGLMFFYLWRDTFLRNALIQMAKRVGFADIEARSNQLPWRLEAGESAQKAVFTAIAGEWMGTDKKRGSTFTWMPQHLADAREETSPRSFLRALAVAAETEPSSSQQAIDFQGIKQGVVAASQVRVTELTEDHWWMARALEPLRGLTVPCDRLEVIDRWDIDRTCASIRNAATNDHALLPVLFDTTHPSRLNDETALLETLITIAVVELRSNGKINFPDIFRVGAGIKRKGGVKPPVKGG